MCIKHPGLRVLVARQVYSHAIATLWNQTFVDVAKTYYALYPDKTLFTFKQGEHIVRFVNGSEIVLAGLDDAERLEKILGGEYGIIYLNECSMIKYQAVTMCKTRLAQNIQGFRNKFLFDENPPSPKHWSYKMFIQHIEPKTDEPLDKQEYVSMLINPKDNLVNLPEDYIKTLESLPDRERRRFLFGEFVKVEGAVYNKFDIDKMGITSLPPMEYYSVGIDNTGNNMAAVLIGWAGGNVYVLESYAAFRMSMTEFNTTIVNMWGKYGYIAYPDPAAGQLNDLISFCGKADNAVEPGLNYIRELMENSRFFIVVDKCQGLIDEMESYRYDDNGRILKVDDHLCDAMRYGVYSHAIYGGSLLQPITLY